MTRHLTPRQAQAVEDLLDAPAALESLYPRGSTENKAMRRTARRLKARGLLREDAGGVLHVTTDGRAAYDRWYSAQRRYSDTYGRAARHGKD